MRLAVNMQMRGREATLLAFIFVPEQRLSAALKHVQAHGRLPHREVFALIVDTKVE